MEILKLTDSNIQDEHICCEISDKKCNIGYAKKKNVPLTIYHIKSKEDGQKMPIPWIINSVFYKGELVTLEMKVERHLYKKI